MTYPMNPHDAREFLEEQEARGRAEGRGYTARVFASVRDLVCLMDHQQREGWSKHVREFEQRAIQAELKVQRLEEELKDARQALVTLTGEPHPDGDQPNGPRG